MKSFICFLNWFVLGTCRHAYECMHARHTVDALTVMVVFRAEVISQRCITTSCGTVTLGHFLHEIGHMNWNRICWWTYRVCTCFLYWSVDVRSWITKRWKKIISSWYCAQNLGFWVCTINFPKDDEYLILSDRTIDQISGNDARFSNIVHAFDLRAACIVADYP
jgi:hypothetical protein